MPGRELHQLVASPPRRELRALLSAEVSRDESEEGVASEDYTVVEPTGTRRLDGAKIVSSLVLGTLVLALLARGAGSLVNSEFVIGAEVQLASMFEDCHTAVSGERCHTDVVWAMRNRKVHPEWYIGLSKCSDFHDFQAFMHTQVLNSGARRCPKPCALKKPHKNASKVKAGTGTEKEDCEVEKDKEDCHTTVPGDECYAHVIHTQEEAIRYPAWYPGLSNESSITDVQYYLHKEGVCPVPCMKKKLKKKDNMTDCHTAMPGDTCFADILLAKDHFIKKHPSWYPGLTKKSSNDMFQAFLHYQKHSAEAAEKACPIPCNRTVVDKYKLQSTCKTAEHGDPCYESVLWGATVGVQTHPEWYPDLTSSSTFEAFQIHLHKDNNTKCHHLPCPCQRPVEGDACYKTVEWVLNEGTTLHPHRFKGINTESSFEEVQAHLHRMGTSKCGRPCKTFDQDSRSPWRKTWL